MKSDPKAALAVTTSARAMTARAQEAGAAGGAVLASGPGTVAALVASL